MAETRPRFKLKKSTRSAIMGVFAVLLLISCPGILILGVDLACSAAVEEWLPMYPNAEVVSTNFDFFRARAFGTTTMTLSSPDDMETVRQFYRNFIIRMAEDRIQRGLASTSWQFAEGDDNTTLIYLYSECGSA